MNPSQENNKKESVFLSKEIEVKAAALVQCPVCSKQLSCPILLSCGHRIDYRCLRDHNKKSCPLCKKQFRSDLAHMPVDTVLEGLTKLLFPTVQRSREEEDRVIAAELRNNMLRQRSHIPREDYWMLLEEELTPEHVHSVIYCLCSPPLICVQRKSIGRETCYYGCPRWSKSGEHCPCKFFQWARAVKRGLTFTNYSTPPPQLAVKKIK